ncbi:MAG: TRC40/GET3/ArsA family transport-energizing ATPase [Candidatus Geothermarchaeales archaeon]
MRVIIYTGKGGTGKSVISCATALKTSGLGLKTLVMSADPAHALRDAFGENVGPEPTEISDRLWALQIDPLNEMRKSYGLIQDYVASVFSARGIDETLAYEIASLPSTTSFFALLKIEEYAKGDDYDLIILDTVPSGETLKFIYFPKLVGTISRKLIKLAGSIAGLARVFEPIIGVPAPSKRLFESEVELIQRMEELGDILRDASTTSLRLIANPDSFSIGNMRRTLMISNLYGINVDLAIINKVLPDEVADEYFLKWKRSQHEYLTEAEKSFYPLPIKRLRLFDSELRGIEMLRDCGEALFQDEDPSQIFYRGTPFQVKLEEDRLEYVVQVPFLDKENCEVERVGDELIVRVRDGVGEVNNFIPLPSMAYRMRLSKAKLLDNKLSISFVYDEEQS